MVHPTINNQLYSSITTPSTPNTIKCIHGPLLRDRPTQTSVFMVLYFAAAQHKQVYSWSSASRPPNTNKCIHGPLLRDRPTQTSVFMVLYFATA